jgi:hypothetical protein
LLREWEGKRKHQLGAPCCVLLMIASGSLDDRGMFAGYLSLPRHLQIVGFWKGFRRYRKTRQTSTPNSEYVQ